jgi:hypothetical protein
MHAAGSTAVGWVLLLLHAAALVHLQLLCICVEVGLYTARYTADYARWACIRPTQAAANVLLKLTSAAAAESSASARLQFHAYAAPAAAAAAAVCEQSVALCEQLPLTVNVTLSCSQVQDLPEISFNIGGSSFSIQPAAYAYQVSCPAQLVCSAGTPHCNLACGLSPRSIAACCKRLSATRITTLKQPHFGVISRKLSEI